MAADDYRTYLLRRIDTLEEVIDTAAERGVRDIETMDDLDEALEELAAIERDADG